MGITTGVNTAEGKTFTVSSRLRVVLYRTGISDPSTHLRGRVTVVESSSESRITQLRE